MNGSEIVFTSADETADEEYRLTPWGCLSETLRDYGVDIDFITPRMGQHMVEDFMELMCKTGNVRRCGE